MACDVVSLGTGRPTVLPVARQAEVVRRLAANVFDAEVSIQALRIGI